MALLERLVGSLANSIPGLVIGVGVVAAAPYVISALRPVLKEVVKGGIVVGQQAQYWATQTEQQWGSLIEEASDEFDLEVSDVVPERMPGAGLFSDGAETRDEEGSLSVDEIQGVGPDYAQLLRSAGVETLADLRAHGAEELHDRLAETNDEAAIVERVPSARRIEGWQEQSR